MIGLGIVVALGAPALVLVAGARWSVSRMRRLDRREIRDSQTWAISEEWQPCPQCGGPMRPGAKICEACCV
jgi:hypothetical protein